ncbi:LuxR C-terminal-related transcriptional regulator (plasmid) [Streptomyces sp. NBC_01281]|uniref:LuxR C-terminal-related transcriptional regulator n=1 Tax=Streptomyces sp. NBC_01281 TaxID=2903811 RepID=UPI002E1603E9|nr:LuxR C-terminal-related transcriptional regulator [Streptomyces sp. NBC_01281]
MTTTALTTPLTATERRVAGYLVQGLKTEAIADEMNLAFGTVKGHLRSVRGKLHCPPRCPRAVVVHRVLSAGEVAIPDADGPAPNLSPAQLRLLRAFAEHTANRDIAGAAGIAPADFHAALAELIADAGVRDSTQLVASGHAWDLLGAKPAVGVQDGGSE